MAAGLRLGQASGVWITGGTAATAAATKPKPAGPGRRSVLVESREVEERLELEIVEVKRKLGITVKPHIPKPKPKLKAVKPVRLVNPMRQAVTEKVQAVDAQKVQRLKQEKNDLEALIALGEI